jgi:hypothetical protein
MRSSPVVRALSPSAQRKKEDELRRLETERDERERAENELVDLDPVPSGKDNGNSSAEELIIGSLARSSQEPLLR